VLGPKEEPEKRKEQERNSMRPYEIRVAELKKAVHESGDYETNEDYRLNLILEQLLAYREAAVGILEQGLDTVGKQAMRLKLIDEALSKLE